MTGRARRAAAGLVALPLLAACASSADRAADDACDPRNARQQALAADPGLRAPPGIEEVERGEIEATFDEIKTRECNDQQLFYDLAAPTAPAAVLSSLSEHLTRNGWTVTAAGASTLVAKKAIGAGFPARLEAYAVPEEQVVEVGVVVPAAAE